MTMRHTATEFCKNQYYNYLTFIEFVTAVTMRHTANEFGKINIIIYFLYLFCIYFLFLLEWGDNLGFSCESMYVCMSACASYHFNCEGR
jgi:hypothetical protein